MKAIAAAIALLVACKPPPPEKWIGLDRSNVSCDDEDHYPHTRRRCIGSGRVYECISDDYFTWQCAELRPATTTPEKP